MNQLLEVLSHLVEHYPQLVNPDSPELEIKIRPDQITISNRTPSTGYGLILSCCDQGEYGGGLTLKYELTLRGCNYKVQDSLSFCFYYPKSMAEMLAERLQAILSGEQTRQPLQYYLDLIYPITLHQENQGYFAEIKDLPGCMAQGESIEEVLENIKDAKHLWLESAYEYGDTIPLPSQ